MLLFQRLYMLLPKHTTMIIDAKTASHRISSCSIWSIILRQHYAIFFLLCQARNSKSLIFCRLGTKLHPSIQNTKDHSACRRDKTKFCLRLTSIPFDCTNDCHCSIAIFGHNCLPCSEQYFPKPLSLFYIYYINRIDIKFFVICVFYRDHYLIICKIVYLNICIFCTIKDMNNVCS